MAGPLYARYVPPKPGSTTAKPQTTLATSNERPITDFTKQQKRKRDEDGSAHPRMSKKKQTSFAKEDSAQEQLKHGVTDSSTERAVPDKVNGAMRKDKQPSTKRKKEKKKQHEQQSEAPETESDLPTQHKAILAKYQRSTQRSESLREQQPTDTAPDDTEEPTVLHDLVPLPQPDPAPESEYKPTFSTLPEWLAEPVVVRAGERTPFKNLNISPKLLSHLAEKGYENTFAIQSAVLPLLLPGGSGQQGDVLVSAATGSGKTLAYVLPLVEALKDNVITSLRALIVVPTRELVTQVRDVAELCVSGSGLQVGTAVGSHSLTVEQEQLVQRSGRYDPDHAEELEQRAAKRVMRSIDADDDLLDDVLTCLPGHVPEYRSKVDILICTPGRLVEHIQSTRGFTLDHLEWLIIDEADRLLDESFQDWVDVVVGSLEREKPHEALSVKEQVLSKTWYPPAKKHARRVICSATMTKDLEKIGALRLKRPTLVSATDTKETTEAMEAERKEYSLPTTLDEYAVPAGDGGDKPLYLLQLLHNYVLNTSYKSTKEADLDTNTSDTGSLGSSDDSSSESDSSSSSEDSEGDISDSEDAAAAHEIPSTHPSRAGRLNQTAKKSPAKVVSGVLIFANTNENTTRLSHLLRSMDPSLRIGTLTISAATSEGRKALRAFRQAKTQILVASDRASRGLDLPDVRHIINYDMPRNMTSYIHRVGRTARAGKEGTAWTLVEDRQARWFWNDIARNAAISRSSDVDRLRVDIENLEKTTKARYTKALGRLKSAVEQE
ncbi:hypothetical protein LTS18_011912 [Coniosporium uncinatum]|uniref:Uncharacterized protein n=1 Tax=Coniosporium uncinatum TaxID=93489 RepID=A0ACC3DCY2_9PEZI|nr:hypothetical protein LTS18_011912 [Coniosporium uncinatum]